MAQVHGFKTGGSLNKGFRPRWAQPAMPAPRAASCAQPAARVRQWYWAELWPDGNSNQSPTGHLEVGQRLQVTQLLEGLDLVLPQVELAQRAAARQVAQAGPAHPVDAEGHNLHVLEARHHRYVVNVLAPSARVDRRGAGRAWLGPRACVHCDRLLTARRSPHGPPRGRYDALRFVLTG
jgi:hypothetical protein